jgi:uncharacterized membrane protein (UPF0182 family)
MMKRWKKRLLIGFGIILALILLFGMLKLIFIDFVIDFWWFKSQKLTIYFLMRSFYRFAVFGFFVAFFFGIFSINFWIASRFVNRAYPLDDTDQKDLMDFLHDKLHRLYIPFSLVIALPIAVPMFINWEAALLFLLGPSSGVADPLFGNDVSFYLFSLPIYVLVQKEVFIAFIILFVGVTFLYWYENQLLSDQEDNLPPGAKVHITILALVILGILSWGILLGRYGLLYETINMPIFHGPGYTEMRVILPFIWFSIIFMAATGISLIICWYRGKGWIFPLILGLLFVLSMIGKNTDFFANMVRKYVVEPNQIAKERSYIEANIQSTLAAFGLDSVETRDFNTIEEPSIDSADPAFLRRLQNIPVWDREMLGGVFEELQGIRTNFSFPTIDVDRYTVGDNYRQVYLGAREIELSKLPEFARNWINIHLQYTHGQGVVMIPAAQAGDEFMTWFIKDIPAQSEFGLPSGQSNIYFGLAEKPYVIVPNDAGEIGVTIGEDKLIVNYTGDGGVPINSLWRKLLFYIYFDDENIFFTAKTNNQSRILFRRNIIDRITHITPFLRLDKDPYIVTTSDGLVWIQDAYTTADNYPMSPPTEDGFNYIRNSVKITVDAYTGRVNYYVSDVSDPIISAYKRIYPWLFKPLSEMPQTIRNHIRYPRDIFLEQVKIYSKYHQEDPERFYRQEDIWEFAKIQMGKELVPTRPYYLTLDIIEYGKDDFLLFMPLSPFGRDNLRALMIAGSDGDNYGKIFAYRFPRDQQVYGPAQIQTLVNQDIIIAEQFTLWNQEGSEVILGKMIIEPMGGTLLYIQPVYLQEEGPLKIPQLKRLIMTLGDAVVMHASLEECAVALEKELARKKTRQEQRFPKQPVIKTPQEPIVNEEPMQGVKKGIPNGSVEPAPEPAPSQE